MADVPMGVIGLLPISTAGYERTVAGFQIVGLGSGAPAPTPVTYVNRVWDTLAGPGFVRWETIDAADPTGISYPGPGTFGVHTSDYCIEYTE
jgi:hypothetical protein